MKKGIHQINIIDSSYSSNPDGVFADLDYLNVFSGKKIIIMPSCSNADILYSTCDDNDNLF